MKCFIKIKSCTFPKLSKDITNFYTHDKILYRKCNKCNLIFQHPIIKNEYKKIYSKSYFDSDYNKKIETKLYLQRKIQYKLDSSHIKKYFQDTINKKILDFGCGNGEFLQFFKSKKFGFEINKSITPKKNITYLNYKTLRSKRLDLVIMRGSIEHLPEPLLALNKICKLIKKNGYLFITATPGSQNISMFLDKKNFNQNKKEHIYHFDHVNLSLILLRYFLFNISIDFQYYKTPYMNIKKDYREQVKSLKSLYNKKKCQPKHYASPGNMMTLVYKKMK